MKTNNDRSGRFAFGVDPDRYHRGRPPFSERTVRWALREAGFASGDRVLEIGAGTGQLSGELLRAGAAVTALEPSAGLAKLLRDSCAGAEVGFEAVESTFEDFEPDGKFAAIASANAFHWIDPAVSYRKAARLLVPGGRLCLFWYFPILADPSRQLRVNAVVREHGFDGLAREPEGYGDALREPLAQGREEIDASGHFRCAEWLLEPRSVRRSVSDYLDLLATLASARDLTAVRSDLLGSVFGDAAGAELIVHEYACVATPVTGAD